MRHVYICDIAHYVGQEVTLKGWLTNRRSSGKIHFLLVRDGTGVIQATVVKGEASETAFVEGDHLPQESALIVHGTVRADRRAPGGYELAVRDLEVVHRAEPYPITPKEHGVAFLMQHRHLWLRSPRQRACMVVRAEVIRACRDFFDSRGFLLLDAPILTPTACEGTTTLFATDYFGQQAYLTQSGQLYMEAGAMAYGKVYCFGPTFRAEKSKTRRHLMEFWMVEPEVAFAELPEIMELAEDLVLAVLERVLARCREELRLLERDTAPLEAIRKPFPRLSYDEALALLQQHGEPLPWGEDFGGGHETVLSSAFTAPVMVHRYPTRCKAFYMQPDPERPEVALCVDVLAPEGYGEIIGGGQRIHDLALLQARLKEHGLPEEPFQWYLDLRRYGSVPHAGFGMGIERVVAWLCGLKHVRESIPFPRLLYHLAP
ncbi:MAG: asparagine--tRNA ligase [Candidatus Tectimicrobiota bacterium]|nr:MAG: asparagine--tRNA ligase [Candidatus Tectomicrobia bacterium]